MTINPGWHMTSFCGYVTGGSAFKFSAFKFRSFSLRWTFSLESCDNYFYHLLWKILEEMNMYPCAWLLVVLFPMFDANTRYEHLYRGSAYTPGAAFPGSTYWTSDDGDWRGFVYRGIKYASAKRFEPSTLNSDHGYLRNLSHPKGGFVCPQIANESPYVSNKLSPLNEDCLYLDVYVPPVFKNHQSLDWAKWPTLVWIHGGQFRMGYKDAMDAAELAMSIGAVVVVPNYRLGPFGFLSTGDHVASGNWALYDLKLALKWVSAHIHGFGGEKTKITLAGERAGGVLVSMLLLDEETRALIHGAVTLSGNTFSPWGIQENPAAIAARLAADVDCPNESAQLITCLKKLSMVELLDSNARIERSIETPLAASLWAPVVDGLKVQFLPSWVLDGPAWNLKGGYLTGYSTDDAAWPLLMKLPRVFGHNTVDQEWVLSSFIPSLLYFCNICNKPMVESQPIAQAVFNRYGFTHTATADDLRKNIIRLTTDLFFAVPAMKESSLYAKNSMSGLGNQLYVVSSEDNYETNSILPSQETGFLFGHAGSAGNNSRTNDAVTRELRRLIGHVVRHGSGFGSQFDRRLGNHVLLGNGHEWRSSRMNVEDLLHFWEQFRSVSC